MPMLMMLCIDEVVIAFELRLVLTSEGGRGEGGWGRGQGGGEERRGWGRGLMVQGLVNGLCILSSYFCRAGKEYFTLSIPPLVYSPLSPNSDENEISLYMIK